MERSPILRFRRFAICTFFASALFQLSIAPAAGAFCLPAPGYPTGPNPHSVVIADFNGDGHLDVAVANAATEIGGPGSNTVSVRMGDGLGGFGTETKYPTDSGPYFMVTADFNGDGIRDLAVSCVTGNVVRILVGGGSGGVGDGTFSSAGDFLTGPSPFRIAVGDYNGDGRQDLAIVNNTYSGSALAVLLAQTPGGQGGVAFSSPTFYPMSSAPVGITTADFNGDGVLDLAATIYGPGKVAILLGHGSGGVGNGTFAGPVEYATVDGASDVRSGDFDEDGILDLAVGANGDGMGVHRGLGSGGVGNGTFGPVTLLAPGANQSDVVLNDDDGDGILDIAAASPAGNTVYVYKGLGSGGVGNGNFGAPTLYAVGAFPTGLAAGDLDQDGHPDLVTACFHGSEIRVLLTDCAPPPSPSPHLDAVRDVPNDQGGKVFVVWLASSLDGPTGTSVTGYRVWRRIPALAASLAARSEVSAEMAASPRVLVRTEGTAVTYWEALVTLPAQRLEGYGYTAPTTQDSLPASNPFTAFFITALTADANEFYNSNVDSGYSVDNLHPGDPHGFDAVYAEQGAALHWNANQDPDLEGYELHRGSSPDFVPVADNRIASPTDTSYLDAAGVPGTFYKLAAVDRHGNCSGFAVAGLAGPTGVSGPVVTFSLAGPWPNPSRSGVFSVSVTHPHQGRVTFEVFDVRGSRVFARRLEGRAPGVDSFTVGADRRLAAGLYLVRVTNESETREAKTVVVP